MPLASMPGWLKKFLSSAERNAFTTFSWIESYGMKSNQITSEMLPGGDLYDIYHNNLELDRSSLLDNPLQPGQFMIIANGKTKLEDDLSLTLSLESSSNQILNIYPNPTQNILNIVFPSRQRYNLTFFD